MIRQNFIRMMSDLVEEVGDKQQGNPTGNSSGNSTGNPTGNSTGNPTGNSTGNHTGNPTGNSTGNPTGNSTGNFKGNPTGNSTGDPDWIVYLPYRSQKDVYDLFIDRDLGYLPCQEFYKIWKRTFPHVRVKRALLRDTVERFLSNLVQEVGKEDEHDKSIIVLPYSTMKDVYKIYNDSHEKDLHTNYSTFRVIMEEWLLSC